MGNAYSSDVVDDAVRSIIDIGISASQNCQSQVFESQDISISGNVGSDINIGDIDWDEVISMNMGCLSTNTTQNSISNAIDEEISQVAKAIGQAFAIPGNSATAQNVTNILTRIGERVKENFQQNCKSTLDTSQGATITNNVDSKVTIASLNWNQNVSNMQSCVQDDSSIVQSKTQLEQEISQQATSEIESILGPIIAIVIIVILIIGGVLLFGEEGLTSWKLWLAVGAVIGLYLVLAGIFGWWPFKPSTSS